MPNAFDCLLSCASYHSACRINSKAIRLIDEIERKRSMHKTWTIILVAIPSVVCFKTLIYGTLNQLSFSPRVSRLFIFVLALITNIHTHTPPIELAKIKNKNLMNGRSPVAHANTHTPFEHTKHEVNYSVSFLFRLLSHNNSIFTCVKQLNRKSCAKHKAFATSFFI